MQIADLTRLCDELIRKGDAAAAVAACDQALSGKLSRPLTAQVLSLKAKSLVAQDGTWEGPAISCLKDALALTKPNSLEYGWVLIAFTAAYAALAYPALCKHYHDAFMKLLQSSPSPDLAHYRPVVEYNLGLAYHEVDSLQEAEDHYLMARALFATVDSKLSRTWVPVLQHNLVDIYLEFKCPEEAGRLITDAYPLLPDEIYGATKRNFRAMYAHQTGDLKEAALWVESGLAHPSCNQATRAALFLTKAEISQDEGDIGKAHDLAQAATRMAANARNPRLGERIYRFLHQLARREEP